MVVAGGPAVTVQPFPGAQVTDERCHGAEGRAQGAGRRGRLVAGGTTAMRPHAEVTAWLIRPVMLP